MRFHANNAVVRPGVLVIGQCSDCGETFAEPSESALRQAYEHHFSDCVPDTFTELIVVGTYDRRIKL